MSLELDPVELGFRRPFTQEVEEKLRLKNPNSEPVAFKVKTTAPKQYCVRPNSGRIEAGEYVEVSVLLQAMKEEPPLDAKCRDKFLVQSVAVSAGDEFTNVAQVWSNIESTAKSSIQEKKIRVTFLPSSGSYSTPARQSTNSYSTNEVLPAYSSPMSTAQTPASGDSASRSADTGSGVAAAVSSAASAVPSSTDEVKSSLTTAQNKASDLAQQANEGLRQRKVGVTSSDSGTGASKGTAMQQAPGGVPVPLVAALCLLSFLLAYLLF